MMQTDRSRERPKKRTCGCWSIKHATTLRKFS